MELIVVMDDLFEPIGEALVVNGICDLKSDILLDFYRYLVSIFLIIVSIITLLSLYSK